MAILNHTVKKNMKESHLNKKKSTMSDNQKEKVGAVIIGGTFQALGIVRSLGERGVPVYVLSNRQCIARFSRYKTKFLKCPYVNEDSIFLKFLLDLAIRDNLNGWIIYPNDDETVCFLSQHKQQLEEYYRVTTPEWDIVKYAYDKMLTYQLAEKVGIAIPATCYPRSIEEVRELEVRFPAILKPSIKEPFYSRTQKKAIRVENKKQLIDEYTRMVPEINPSQTLMVQELIPGRTEGLFSVGSLCSDGKLLAHVAVRRPRQHPMDFGHATTYAQTVYLPQLVETSKKILTAMGYSGLSEVEFMLDSRDGQFKLIEINPRPWGWHSIAIGAGVDLPYLSYLDTLGEKVKQDGYSVGVKWIRLITDIPTVAIELLKGKMSLSKYLNSLKGKKQFAVASLDDPLPFIVEFILFLRFWKRTGVLNSRLLKKIRSLLSFRKYSQIQPIQDERTTPVRIIDPTTDSMWDEFVTGQENSTVFHTSAWARVIKETYDYSPRYHITENEDGQMRAAIPFYFIRCKFTGRRLVCLPFSDYCWPLGGDKADIELLLNKTKNELNTGKGAPSYVEIRGWQNESPEAKLKLISYDYYTRYLLELEPDLKALSARFHHSVRRCIHQAEKRDVTVRLTSSEADIELFYKLHVATRKKLGVFPQPRNFFKSIFRNVISQNQGFVGIAECEGKTVAGVVFLGHGDTIYYKYNASDEKYLKKRPNHLIIWEAIKYACAHNYKYFDFGRCSPEDEGLRTFKSRWGAKAIPSPYYYFPVKRGFFNVTESSVKYRAMRLFSYVMPKWVCMAAGSFLYRHIG